MNARGRELHLVNKQNGIINELTASLKGIKTQLDKIELVTKVQIQKDLMLEEGKIPILSLLLTQFEAKTKGLNDYQKYELKKQWGTMQAVLSSPSKMKAFAVDIEFDFSTKPRLSDDKGTAILVAGSIYEACRYYEIFQNTTLKIKQVLSHLIIHLTET